jgi:hypothetical protein
VTNTTQPQQSQARQMVQLTLTKVDNAQKNKRNLDTMTLSDSDDERGDKKKIVMSTTMRARSTQRLLEMPRRLHSNVPTTTTQTTRQRRPLLLLLQSLGKKVRNLIDCRRGVRHDAGRPSFFSCPLRYYWADLPPAGYILCWSSSQPRKVSN